MWLLLIVAGLVGLLAPQQFPGQPGLSVALLVLGALLIVGRTILLLWLAKMTKKNFNLASRHRRGF